MPALDFSTSHTVSGSTFIQPPLDGTLTIPEIYDFHFYNNANHPLFVYDEKDGGTQVISWGRAVGAIHTVGKAVQATLGQPDESGGPVIAILAVIDQFSYFALTAGIIRAGYRAFPISPRNSDVGVTNLLQKVGVEHLFVSKDRAMQGLAVAARDKLGAPMHFMDIPSFEALFGPLEGSPSPFFPLRELPKRDVDYTAVILHSSGSTSFPKPINISHRNILQWGSQPHYGEVDVCGRILSNHSLPFFHAMGVVSLSWATMAGITLSNFAPTDPPIIPTPDHVYASAVATGSNLIFCVPAFLEEWSQDPGKVTALQTFDAVLFGGAPIQKTIGDALAARGVRLYPFYGATEIGGTSKFLPKSPPEEGWEYFKISSHTNPSFINKEDKEGVHQLVFQNSASHTISVINRQISGTKSYDTNDLLIRHPTNPELWKIYGRADDQIMHSTGEKTNPVPLETIMNKHPAVTSSLIFGRGRFQAGVLIEPSAGHSFEPGNLDRLAEFRNLIWPSIEEANRFAPSHSRVFKELILITEPSKPFQFTPKGTPKRQVILDAYEEEIGKIYTAVEESSQVDIPIPLEFSPVECLEFVKTVIEKVMLRPMESEEDIFQNGCDSLQATWIRNTVLHALRQSPGIPVEDIPINFVYLNPSILRLGGYLVKIARQGARESRHVARATTIAEMTGLVDKYSQKYPVHDGTKNAAIRETALLTGGTGSLGSYVLENLILSPEISRIYALNRRSTFGGRQRQRAAFEERGISVTLLDSPKLVFLDCDTTLDMLGLDQLVYEELRMNITCIFHIAWRVDFNVAISSMEPLIAGTRRLIDLALTSPYSVPPRFVFTSSIGVLRNSKESFVPEVAMTDASVAVGSGYPESKWVAERILTLAAESTGLAPIIVRIGQLSGGRNGCWNPSEWVPSVVRSGELLGCLPQAPGVVSWIPVHTAAACLVEMRQEETGFFHLVHPNPILWSVAMSPISKVLSVPLVPYSTWLSALESSSLHGNDRSSEATIHNPALRLLDFFQSANKPLISDDAEAFGFPRLSTQKALKAAPSLQSGKLSYLNNTEIGRWLDYWVQLGHLSERSSSITYL